MQLYTHWARTHLDCLDADGSPYHLIAYAGSNESLPVAQAAGHAVLRARHARLLAGERLREYEAGTLPLREPIVESIAGPHGKPLAAITRNRYGSLVLNAPEVMWLDVDDADLRLPLEPATEPPFSWKNFFRHLFTPPPPAPLLDPHEQMQLRLAAWLHLHPEWKFRLYRTRRGYRLLVMHQLLAPGSAVAQEIFAVLRVDKTYVRLCLAQGCYRARLSPKPWRMGWHRPPHTFPYDTPAQAQQQADWEQEYAARSPAYAVCTWVGEYGTGPACPEAQQLAELHDAACLGSGPLA